MTAGADQLALLIQTLGRTYGRAPSVADFLSAASELNLLNEQMIAVHADAKSMLAASRHNVSLKTWVDWLTVANSADDDLKCVVQNVVLKALESPTLLKAMTMSPDSPVDVIEAEVITESMTVSAVPVVGRDHEIREILRILCRRTKSNPVLLGPAGVGKTAIVDGVRNRLETGDVPDILKGRKIVDMPASRIKSSQNLGEAISLVRSVVDAARNNNDILFVDECHALFGVHQIADELKPLLARGDISMIGATTDREYRQEVASDAALDRRFQAVLIQQLGRAGTLACLEVHRDHLASLRGIAVSDSMLSQLYDVCDSLMPTRSFPDKAIDILEDVVAECLISGLTEPNEVTLRLAVDSRVGVTSEKTTSDETEKALIALGLNADLSERMAAKLSIASVGLDVEPQRPNLSVVVRGWQMSSVNNLVDVLAGANGSKHLDPIYIDLSPMVTDIVSPLIGASPQYVGYDAQLPVHALLQRPGAVVVFIGYANCHGNIRSIVDELVRSGLIVDGALRPISASQSVIVVVDRSIATQERESSVIGFRQPEVAELSKERTASFTTTHPWFDFEINTGPDVSSVASSTNLELLIQNYRGRGIDFQTESATTTALCELSKSELQDLFDHVLIPQALELGLSKPMRLNISINKDYEYQVSRCVDFAKVNSTES